MKRTLEEAIAKVESLYKSADYWGFHESKGGDCIWGIRGGIILFDANMGRLEVRKIGKLPKVIWEGEKK